MLKNLIQRSSVTKTLKLKPKEKGDDDSKKTAAPDEESTILSKTFTVKDAMRLLQGEGREKEKEKKGILSYPRERDECLQEILQFVREKDYVAINQMRQMASVARRKQQKIVKKKEEVPLGPSNSATLAAAWASSGTPLKTEELLVPACVREGVRRIMRFKALPNSTFKRLPKTLPPPPPSFEELIQIKSKEKYLEYYGPDKPRPDYPILPPKERPPPPPPPPKMKKKKGKKGKKERKTSKKVSSVVVEEEPFDMTVWRKANLPAASTRLTPDWLVSRPCDLPTPPPSRPPSPPGDLPQPISYFGYFVKSSMDAQLIPHRHVKGLGLGRRLLTSIRPMMAVEGSPSWEAKESISQDLIQQEANRLGVTVSFIMAEESFCRLEHRLAASSVG